MDKNRVLSARFYGFSKYLRIISIISLLLYVVFAALSQGQGNLVFITYGLLMVAIVGIIQSVVLLVLAKYYQSKIK